MGHSSVACAAADFVFLHLAFTNLLEDGTSLNKLGRYVKTNPRCQKSFHLKF